MRALRVVVPRRLLSLGDVLLGMDISGRVIKGTLRSVWQIVTRSSIDMETYAESHHDEKSFRETLIREVFQRRLLWDMKSSQYKRKDLVATAWNEVAFVMCSTVDTCKKVWKNLRDSFRRAHLVVTRAKRSGAPLREEVAVDTIDEGTLAAGADVLPKWPYYDSLRFLKDTVEPRRTISNRAVSAPVSQEAEAASYSQQTTQVSLQGTLEDVLGESSRENSPLPTTRAASPSGSIHEDVPLQHERAEIAQPPPAKKTKFDDAMADVLSSLATEMRDVNRALAEESTSCDHFGGYVAASLKELPEGRRHAVQLAIVQCFRIASQGMEPVVLQAASSEQHTE